MKKIILIIITLFLTAQTIEAQVVLDTNGVTIKWTGTTVPSPYFVQANPRGTMEWFAIVDNSTKSNITNYAKNIQSGITYFTPPSSSIPISFNNIITTLVNNMSSMFSDATDFNQSIDYWDTSNVTRMEGMFDYATSFNQPIGSWNVSKVTSTGSMFQSNSQFNQYIGSWDVSSLQSSQRMFQSAVSFNQDIGNWNVSGVTSMRVMFYGASAFNQNIGSWNIINVTNFTDFLNAKTSNDFSASNLDSIYNGWSSKSVKSNVTANFGTIKYTSAAAAGRATLVNTYGWTITDGGQV
jgi:surface protein